MDDTVEIREIHEANDGRDPFPVLVCRQRLPKDRTHVECKSIILMINVAHFFGKFLCCKHLLLFGITPTVKTSGDTKSSNF